MGMFGLSIKAKANGVWNTVKPSVKVGGSWVNAKVVWVKALGNWKKVYEYEWVYTYPSGVHYDQDIDLLSGIDKYHNVKIIIPSTAALVASSTSGYALKTGSGFGGSLTIENNGSILGRGGNGGNGGYRVQSSDSPAPTNGLNGGTAVHVQSNFKITGSGIIAGGGGGGGGGAGSLTKSGNSGAHSGGGGGGGGVPYGSGGLGHSSSGNQGSTAGANGGAATLTASGSGGTRGTASADAGLFYPRVYSRGGNGGNGGGYGSNGSNGSAAELGTWKTATSSGGSNGSQYYNPNSYTITQV